MATRVENGAQVLSADQQRAIAQVELTEFRRRERLARQARTYSGKRWLSPVAFILAVAVTGKNIQFPYQVVAFSILALLFAVIHVHIAGINRRLDAVLELLPTSSDAPDEDNGSPLA